MTRFAQLVSNINMHCPSIWSLRLAAMLLYFRSDCIHLSEAGHERAARLIADVVVPLVAER